VSINWKFVFVRRFKSNGFLCVEIFMKGNYGSKKGTSKVSKRK